MLHGIFFRFPRIVYTISEKCNLLNKSSILDKCARKDKKGKIQLNLVFLTYTEKVAPCIIEIMFSSSKVDDETPEAM